MGRGQNPEKKGEGMVSRLSERKISVLSVFNFFKGGARKTGLIASTVVRVQEELTARKDGNGRFPHSISDPS